VVTGGDLVEIHVVAHASRSPPAWSAPECRTCARTRKAGLVDPQRTPGGTRLYGLADIERLRQIAALLGEGLNLAGIAMVLQLEADNARLRREISQERDRRRGR
jgi:MerR HTH family regulatory protein